MENVYMFMCFGRQFLNAIYIVGLESSKRIFGRAQMSIAGKIIIRQT